MPKFRSVIVVTYGRSGSTLLQGILNSMPGFLIRGENYNFPEGLFVTWKRIEQTRKHHSRKPRSLEANSPWFGARAIDEDLLNHNMSRLVQDILVPPERRDEVACYGFKEIRYPTKTRRFNEYLAFLRIIMPDLAVIMNTRKQEDVTRSGFFARRDTDEVVKLVDQNEKNFFGYLAAHPDHAFHISYEDVLARSSRLRELHEFLDVPYSEERIEEVLAVKHSGFTKRGDDDDDGAEGDGGEDESDDDASDDDASDDDPRAGEERGMRA